MFCLLTKYTCIMGYINIVLLCGSIQNHKIDNNAFESVKKKIINCSEHYCM